ncbi:MAG: prolyl oligopeptidase family serine peptidase, partial [Oscillospiraceae bacterium]|nr:prolyl oligopeptidase family serine peptidase [Oscillospiraceae bacterium]
MIDEGKVDPKRIYVTGMSMGGAGTVRAMSVGSDLFAAAVPVCPSMTPETFTILKSIRRPIWVTSAYIDHTLYRHKYLVDAVMNMRDNGNDNAHLTLFSPEDLEKYDVSITPSLMQAENYGKLFRQNHWSWVPTYKNEYGIMSWLLNQTKDD